MSNIKLLDGAMGTMLQNAGMKTGERPEIFGMNNPDVLEKIQGSYIEAGSEVIFANTFGANSHKLKGIDVSVSEVIASNVKAAKNAVLKYGNGRNVKVALDIGPIGELLEPLGSLKAEEAYDVFKEMCIAGQESGADLVIFETMSDLGELRQGVFAASENTDLPIWTTMSFEQSGRTFSGTSVASFAMTMNALDVEALGINCSLGPDEIYPFIKEMKRWTDKPLIVKPNAGLPDPVSGMYALDAKSFAAQMKKYLESGVSYMGGCCGTTPEFIKETAQMLKELQLSDISVDDMSVINGVCSSSKTVPFKGIKVIGERINPTGKKRFQQALLEKDYNYIKKCAIEQEEAGADILDINVGYPGIDEVAVMKDVVNAVQSVSGLPLCIDSSEPKAIEAGLRAFNGKAIVNSVNADQEKLDSVLPIVKKYGSAVIGLTMDKSGIPDSTDARFDMAVKISETAKEYGISKDDMIIDCLALTISSMQDQGMKTLGAIRRVKDELGLHETLGVSNISFGLPKRNNITASFLSQAAVLGLDLPIINPNSKEIMDVITSIRAISGEDNNCEEYINRFAETDDIPAKTAPSAELSLEEAVLKGLGDEVERNVKASLTNNSEMDVINNELIPALDKVGILYEKGKLFLPQLISAANAAGCGFEVIKKQLAESGMASASKGSIILATVKGDIHDIGKNIVKVVLENYGYRIIDLGKDVDPERIVEAAIKDDIKLVGLSALMTTTVGAMEETIRLLRKSGHECLVFVGGAVLTPEYAQKIGADFYTKDAKASADVARKVLG